MEIILAILLYFLLILIQYNIFIYFIKNDIKNNKLPNLEKELLEIKKELKEIKEKKEN